ncbi:MAG TPA: DUF4350 domain-containing protein [Croceibacterium sp.]
MSRAATPFSPRTVLAVLVVGMGAFLVFLYAIGAGWDGSNDRDGGAHAAANGVNGFAGLVRLLEAQGHEVSLSRSDARLEDEALLVLTPQLAADGERVAEILALRRYLGPTLVILPKWLAIEASQVPTVEAREGWVMLGGTTVPEWLGEIPGLEDEEPEIGRSRLWHGLEISGPLPDPGNVLGLDGNQLTSLVIDDDGRTLAGYVDDNGLYPELAAAAGTAPNDEDGDGTDSELWPVVVVAEPDLMNNYGMADRERARLAHAIVDAALEGYEMPVVFDLTLAGLGRSENLLTLAFTPPFLAATLSLLLAALVIAWRAFRRFGAPVAEAPALAKGKRQLARNGAALVERARRLHLLGPPYAALVTARIAEALAIREPDPQAREAAIARVLAARGIGEDFAARAEALRKARHSAELLRAAGVLRTIERTLTP